MIIKLKGLRKLNAILTSVDKYSWWPKCRTILKMCHTIIKHIVNIIKIIDFIRHLIP